MRTSPLRDATIQEAIQQRRSFRAFLDRPVDEPTLRKVMDIARFSPSSTNMQPWQVFVLQGEKKQQLDRLLLQAFDEGRGAEPQLSAYLKDWFEPFRSRRFACGTALYKALGIDRKDKPARVAQSRNNFNAFGAPVVLLFAMNRGLNEGSVFDCGMFYQSVMLAAMGEGLETCPEASLIAWPKLLQDFLEVDDSWRFLSGMALGYADYEDLVNQYKTGRAEVDDFCRF